MTFCSKTESRRNPDRLTSKYTFPYLSKSPLDDQQQSAAVAAMLTLYTETHLEVKPVTTASALEFQIPRKNGSYNRSKHSTRKSDVEISSDEKAYSENCLAISSAFYFRESRHYPRTFTWRIRDHRILEIQPADLSRSERDQKEAYLTLVFEFQDDILPLGITLADPPKKDELHAFVCTTKNEIFNLRLPTDYFRSSSNISQNVSDWCRPVDVSSLSIDTVYQLYASTAYEIFVAFTGGRIQALTRKADSETWSQDFYDDSSWGSTLRGIVSRRGHYHIEHKSTRLAPTTVQGMVASPDTNYLYTVCLNHTLRIWHLPSGKLAETKDLLDIPREQNERIQLSPSEPGLVRLIQHPKARHPILVTYTPHEGGQFKFWNIKGGLTDALVVDDRYPKAVLSPPDPDPTGNTIWSVVGFDISPGSELKPSQMWILWRNNNHHQVHTLHFDFPSLAESWETNWVRVASSSNGVPAPDMLPSDTQDVTTKWLEYLLFPGRYSVGVLEHALARHQALSSMKISSSQRNKSLVERLCSTIAANVSLRKYNDTELGYDHFIQDTDRAWRNFWRMLESMNDGRQAPLSFSFDKYTDMAWISMADYCTAIRECSKIELLLLNDSKGLENLGHVVAERWPHRKTINDTEMYSRMGKILSAAESFRKRFSPELSCGLWQAIEAEMFAHPTRDTSETIASIYNDVIVDTLSEEAEDQLIRDLRSVGTVNNEIFLAIVELLRTASKRPKSNLRSTIFGSSLLSSALLDSILSDRQILLDLLVLTIFVDDTDSFDPSELFQQILTALKEQQRNLWLATHSRLGPLEFLGPSTKSSGTDLVELTSHNGRSVSILEDVLTKSIRPQPAVERPMMYLFTELLSESQSWISGNDAVTPEDAAVHIQCDLLVHKNIALATEFIRFQPATPWSTYVKGRLRLDRGEYAEAANHFRKAAFALACGKAIGDLKEFSAGLLSALDAEYFNSGLPRYFQHIMELFERQNAYTQISEFARLSLEALTPGQKEPVNNFRTEVLSRLFVAELKRKKFDAAYEALLESPDHALQKTYATTLVDAMLDPTSSLMSTPSAVRTLQKLPWSLHPSLMVHLDHHLVSLAKKQTSVPSIGHWTSGVDYLSILHALRLTRKDYRGATSVLLDRLRLIQRSGRARSEPQATSIRHALLALINALTCVASDEAYILVNANDDPRIQSMKRRRQEDRNVKDESRKRKKIIITLDDLRREYQQVLDRCSRIERGDFDFDIEGTDEDEEMEETQVNGNGSKFGGDSMQM